MDRKEILQNMISEYRKKIDTYESMIREWETELGSETITQLRPDQQEKNGKPSGAVSSLVRNYQFFGKSQVEAAKLFLEAVGHPLTTEEIMEGIEKGGVKLGGKNRKDKKTNFYTILFRDDDFGRVARNTWGLVSWPGVSKKKSGPSHEENAETKTE